MVADVCHRGLGVWLLTALLWAVFFTSQGHADFIQIGVDVDGYAFDENADGTFDSVYSGSGYDYVEIGYQEVIEPRADQERRGILEFDLSALPAGAVIDSATLYLWNATDTGDPFLRLYGYAGDGNLSTGDAVQSNLLQTWNPASTSYEAREVTSFIQARVDNSDSHAGFTIQLDSLVDGDEHFFYAVEHDTGNAARLDVTYTPEPASLLLAVLAGIGGWLVRLRSGRN